MGTGERPDGGVAGRGVQDSRNGSCGKASAEQWKLTASAQEQ